MENVVGAPLEGAHAVDRVGARRRQHDHGNVPVPAAARLPFTQPRAQVGLAGEHDVRPGTLGDIEGLRAPTGHDHVEAVGAQVALEIARLGGIGVGKKEGCTHTSKGRAARSRRPVVLSVECVTIIPQPSERAAPELGRRLQERICPHLH